MRYCRFCGTQVPDDSIFCPRCGKELAMPETSKAKFRVSGEPSPMPSATPKSSNQRIAQSSNQKIAQSSNEEVEPKKKSSLWGCTIFFVIFTVACVLGVFIYNSFFTGRENPLIPKDDTVATAVVEEKETAEPVNEEPSETVEVLDGESFLQRRVQKIYDDVLFNSNRKGCVQQYCTDDLKVLISKAEATGEYWIDYDFWTYSNDSNNPSLESVRVDSYSNFMADVKVAVRPYADGQAVNVIMLKMERENGQWLIDDFLKNGKSVRLLALRAINENYARYDVADTLY